MGNVFETSLSCYSETLSQQNKTNKEIKQLGLENAHTQQMLLCSHFTQKESGAQRSLFKVHKIPKRWENHFWIPNQAIALQWNLRCLPLVAIFNPIFTRYVRINSKHQRPCLYHSETHGCQKPQAACACSKGAQKSSSLQIKGICPTFLKSLREAHIIIIHHN